MNLVTFLTGVDATNVHPAIWLAVGVAWRHHKTLSPLDMVITSMGDGSHSVTNSLHKAANAPSGMCQAVDIRTIDIPVETRARWAALCKSDLDPLGFDIVHHTGGDGLPLHLHIEYQPKSDEPDIFATIGGFDHAFTPHRTEAQQPRGGARRDTGALRQGRDRTRKNAKRSKRASKTARRKRS